MRSLFVIVAAVPLASCVHRSRPESPVPVSPPAVLQSPAVDSTRDSAPAPPRQPTDTLARRDSVLSAAEVAREKTRVFGDSVVAPPTDSAPTWDIDVMSYASQSRVQHFVDAFTGSARDRIVDRLQQGTRFEPLIRTKLRQG